MEAAAAVFDTPAMAAIWKLWVRGAVVLGGVAAGIVLAATVLFG